MGLNKSKGNMYEFVTHTWNPLVGTCPHGCSYCSTNKLRDQYPVMEELYSGKPRLNENQFKTNLGKDNFIFVCAQNDLFAKAIPMEYILRIIRHCMNHNNRYLFQSKNPSRMGYFHELPNMNSVVCTTIETNRFYPKIMRNSPKPEIRVEGMELLFDMDKYVTIEPILDFDLEPMVELIKRCEPEQVNIGADSGNNNLPEPSYDKVLELIDRLKEFTTISKKKNLARLEQAVPQTARERE